MNYFLKKPCKENMGCYQNTDAVNLLHSRFPLALNIKGLGIPKMGGPF